MSILNSLGRRRKSKRLIGASVDSATIFSSSSGDEPNSDKLVSRKSASTMPQLSLDLASVQVEEALSDLDSPGAEQCTNLSGVPHKFLPHLWKPNLCRTCFFPRVKKTQVDSRPTTSRHAQDFRQWERKYRNQVEYIKQQLLPIPFVENVMFQNMLNIEMVDSGPELVTNIVLNAEYPKWRPEEVDTSKQSEALAAEEERLARAAELDEKEKAIAERELKLMKAEAILLADQQTLLTQREDHRTSLNAFLEERAVFEAETAKFASKKQEEEEEVIEKTEQAEKEEAELKEQFQAQQRELEKKIETLKVEEEAMAAKIAAAAAEAKRVQESMQKLKEAEMLKKAELEMEQKLLAEQAEKAAKKKREDELKLLTSDIITKEDSFEVWANEKKGAKAVLHITLFS
eukprot:TRINITY_DN1561_c0_g1_i2.p1 TRINITY_DN1561_c0_g1~~TRINITY_DN1561_c0_g1_i2.p1  ORF type:complete len:427 (+),score=122.75 TRINITY_DN1561_c0_g1_i2:76-1281(+)